MKLEDIFKKNRPKVSQSTINTYLSQIRNISRYTKVVIQNQKDVVDNLDTILNYLKDLNLNNRKTKFSALVVLLDTDKKYDGKEETLKKLRKLMTDDLRANAEKDRSQKLTEKQKEVWLTWPQVLEVYRNLEKMIKPIWDKKKWTLDERQMVQKYVVLSLYTLIAPRRSTDYLQMKIRNINKDKDNHIKKGRTPKFVFHIYKNSSRIGTQEIDIPFKLYQILTKWTKDARTEYLLVNSAFKKPAPSFMTKQLNDIFGRNISTSMLRHIYLTYKFGDVDLKELEETTEEMGNSKISRTLAYVSKEHAEESKEEKKNPEV